MRHPGHGIQRQRGTAALADLNLLLSERLIMLAAPTQLKRIRHRRFAFLYTRDHVGATEPVGLGQVGLRPLGRMIGMRVIKTDNVFAALSALPLNANEFSWIDVVTVLWRVAARVSAARN